MLIKETNERAFYIYMHFLMDVEVSPEGRLYYRFSFLDQELIFTNEDMYPPPPPPPPTIHFSCTA